MATKLEREAETIAKKMRDLTVEVDAFGKRKLATLPAGTAWPLFQAALGLVSAAARVQAAAAARHFKDTKKHFSEAARP